MSQVIEVKVPDIGDFKDVPIIELCVKEGDTVNAEDALVTPASTLTRARTSAGSTLAR